MRTFIRETVNGEPVRGFLPLYQRSSGYWHAITDDPVATVEQAEDLCIDHLVEEMKDLRADAQELVERIQRLENSLNRLRDVPGVLDQVFFRGQEWIVDGDGSVRLPGERQGPGARESPGGSHDRSAADSCRASGERSGDEPGDLSGEEPAEVSGDEPGEVSGKASAARHGCRIGRDRKWDASFGVSSRFAARLEARFSSCITIDAALVSLLRRVAGEYALSPERTLQMISDAVDNEPSEFILAVGEVCPEHVARAAEFMVALCQSRGKRSVWARERERWAKVRGKVHTRRRHDQ